jgi:hypothetical protein
MTRSMGETTARKVMGGVAAAALFAAGLIFSSSPASAAPATFQGVTSQAVAAGPVGNCPNGYHCVYFLGFSSNSHNYFNSDTNFAGDTFNVNNGSGAGAGQTVNDNVVSARNATSGNYESHFYINSGYNSFAFCLNPNTGYEYLPSSLQNRVSSMQLRGRTSVNCIAN